jgi:crotonobetainyl-CoA:carnitine CoA-transferase CaiB-like acyl-CoA transferase
MSERPLEGLRVVDLADEKGELTGRLLADFGADVIRVEPPGGAASRCLTPMLGDDSLYFAFRNFNKRGVVLDLENAADRKQLADLAARADVFIESFAPGTLAGMGLAPESLVERNPGLIALSITDFGQTGPYRDWVATDATMEAIGGMQWKAGIPDKPPLLPPGAIAYDVASVMATFGVMSALLQRTRTGHGQTLDLSVLEALAQTTDWSFSNASFARAKGSESPELRFGSGPMYTIYACKTGYVRLVILSPRQWRAMREWLGEPDYLQDPIYDGFIGRMGIADALMVTIGDLFASMPHEEVAFEAQRRGIVCTPVLTPEETLVNEHLVSRGTFVDAEYAEGKKGPIASGYFELDGERQGYRQRAPKLGEHQKDLEGLWPSARPRPAGPRPEPSLPLEGFRVLDFGIGGVGVEAGRLFGEYGADVVKIETRTYPDFMRVIMGTEMSASFASSSRSKRGFGVNLKHDAGLEVLHGLAEHADVVIENNSTGTMTDMGVGYETLSKVNPRICMARTRAHGQGGTRRGRPGRGRHGHPRGPAPQGRRRARQRRAHGQPQRTRRALGLLPLRGGPAVGGDHLPQRRGLEAAPRGAGRARVGDEARARERSGPLRRPGRARRGAHPVDLGPDQDVGDEHAPDVRRSGRSHAHRHGPDPRPPLPGARLPALDPSAGPGLDVHGGPRLPRQRHEGREPLPGPDARRAHTKHLPRSARHAGRGGRKAGGGRDPRGAEGLIARYSCSDSGTPVVSGKSSCSQAAIQESR